MSTQAAEALEVFQQQVGVEQPAGEFHSIDQSQIDAFANLTLDRQFIHVDPQQAAQSPFGSTIAHGFFCLSLLTHLTSSIPRPNPDPAENATIGLNYGLDRVRFPTPVKVGSRIRARQELLSAKLKGDNAIQLTHRVTVDIADEEKPACVAEWLTYLDYSGS